MGIAKELASRIVSFKFSDIDDDALQWAKWGILDTVGVTLAGFSEGCTQIIEQMHAADGTPEGGPALLFGSGKRASVLNAAEINGVASHALDFDDCNNTLGGHPSAPILPGLIALAEARKASGKDVIAAYLIGFETETAIARVVHFHHYEKGWHPTATLGTFGAAAAACHLMGLDEEKTAVALGLAVSLAAGVKANFGTMTKPLHVGETTRNGLAAALLAEQGFTANPGAFEHSQGFLELFNGEGNYDTSRLLEGWADPFDIVSPGLAIKKYPCCGSTHSAIDAMLALREKHGLNGDNVTEIISHTHPRRLKHTNRPNPQTSLDAKFSVQYTMARALVDGRVIVDNFEGDAINDKHIRDVMTRITANSRPHTEPDEHFFAEVSVTTKSGETFTQWIQQPQGRGPKYPLPDGALKAKFEGCAERVLTAVGVEQLHACIEGLETADDINTMTALIEKNRIDTPHQRVA
ncbi:MAG: MmgE/PrpD family protein [Rhodospirillales bacterium]|jgi:2-methylcitrate dehydratase PrpD|nr:MmgE/PrpD family protein [Rhodospirillales bacterium]MBT3905534.1 MmgE/PrpD family protein [Rhodospirillaceae bacterium]MBT5035946.1 MmgE/PrpD family protein [Rhodospirillaceae bacterium]MBT6220292.1 MmgE/PrpD family protein [Rhodospirillaceae bacterium]MBT6362978.1 MmgE/PrpD family protein [Rhodospirillaceae bacterium]